MKATSFVVVAARCALFAATLSCEHHPARSHRDYWTGHCGGSAHCDTLANEQHARVGGADIIVTGCEEDYRRSAFNASWRVVGRSRHVFEWAAAVHENDVFPLHGMVAQMLGCAIDTPPIFPGPEVSILFSPATFQWAAPAPENVFLPFENEVLLDHDFHLRAWIRYEKDGNWSPSVHADVAGLGEGTDVYGPMREGFTFPWGDLRATVVRIVERDAPIIGWVEVSLSDPHDADADAR